MPITFAPDYKSTPKPHLDLPYTNLKAAVALLLAERPLVGDGSVRAPAELRELLKKALEACP